MRLRGHLKGARLLAMVGISVAAVCTGRSAWADSYSMYATVLAAYLSNSPLIAHFPTAESCTADNLGIGTN